MKSSSKHQDTNKGTESGNEAARGIHSAKGDSKSSDRSTESQRTTNDRPGSEPLKNRSEEHVSGYGGKGGDPKTSSDQR
jgi:hypothetical protein